MSKAKKASPEQKSSVSPVPAEPNVSPVYPSREKAISALFIGYGICSLCLFVILLFFPGMKYGGKRVYAPNILLMLTGIVLVLSFSFWKPVIPFLCKPSNGRFVTLSACIAFSFLFQVIAVSQYYFITNWDVTTVFQNSLYIAYGKNDQLNHAYFSTYPNNILITYLYVFLIRINPFLSRGISNEIAYLGLVIFHCALSQLAGILLYFTVKRITENTRTAVISYIFYVLVVLLSPWISVPYTDSLGLIFPVLILYAFFCWPDGKLHFLKWLVFALLTGVGYQIKPQAAIVSIAILLITLVKKARLQDIRNHLKQIGLCAGGLAVGVALSLLLSFHVRQALPFEYNPEKYIGPLHYIMMGLNEKTMGVYSQSDVVFSTSFSTSSERTAETLRVIQERIESMGWLGVLKQLVQKTLSNFNDGTFFWGGEGRFYSVVPERDSALSHFLENVYYNQTGQEGAYYGIWSNFAHMMWLTVLVFGGFASFTARKREIGVVMLALLGLAAFELIFEARARYFFMYTPLYIILASVGVTDAQEKIRLAVSRFKNRKAGNLASGAE